MEYENISFFELEEFSVIVLNGVTRVRFDIEEDT